VLVILAGCGDHGDGTVASASGDGGATTPDSASDGGGSAGIDTIASDGSAPDSAPPGDLLGAFELTYYWVAAEADFPGAADTDIFDPACRILATVPEAFARSLSIEGTGRLNDGRLLNYDGACGCPYSPCFFVVDADHPWGVGVQDRALVPFRSVAVDPQVIAFGDRLYALEIDGLMMPGDPPWGGFVHDGCLVADDTGGAIVGRHIDFFAALRAYYRDLDSRLGLSMVTLHTGAPRCR
jgi:3D (Asp-Asp-Asp) domain-containing protein